MYFEGIEVALILNFYNMDGSTEPPRLSFTISMQQLSYMLSLVQPGQQQA